jgi:hypothetical protein
MLEDTRKKCLFISSYSLLFSKNTDGLNLVYPLVENIRIPKYAFENVFIIYCL